MDKEFWLKFETEYSPAFIVPDGHRRMMSCGDLVAQDYCHVIEFSEYEKLKTALTKAHELLKGVCPDAALTKEIGEILK